MEDKGLNEFVQFVGRIRNGMEECSLVFHARVRGDGEVEFKFDTLQIRTENRFIYDRWDGAAGDFEEFSLTGRAEDGTTICTGSLMFTSFSSNWDQGSGRTMKLDGECSEATFRRTLSEPGEVPCILKRIKGFRSFRRLWADCPLGRVEMHGPMSSDNADKMTGQIAIMPSSHPGDLATWRAKAEKLLEHVRRLMSFASSAMLQSPITEYYFGTEVEIVARAQTVQRREAMATIHYGDLQGFFRAAVSSHFSAPIEVKNLFHAIEWFSMQATYSEIRLINAMTVLENLIASNLDENESLIRPKNEFEKTRRTLRKVLRSCVKEWGTQDKDLASEIVMELNERLGDLNRRSLLSKLKTLAKRWSIPLDGISEQQIADAKRARDLVVHRGYYRDGDDTEASDLFTHVLVIREIVVRILFSAIGYRGGYISYLGGMHDATFPPGT